MTMDLSQFDTVADADRGATLTLVHPYSGVPLVDDATKEPVTISVLGADSHKYTEHLKRAKDRARQNLAKLGRKAIRSQEEIDAEQLEVAIKCTTGWRGIYWKGAPLVHSEANARMLYSERRWVLEQVVEFMEDRANYAGN